MVRLAGKQMAAGRFKTGIRKSGVGNTEGGLVICLSLMLRVNGTR